MAIHNTKPQFRFHLITSHSHLQDIRECSGLPKRMYDLVEKNFAKFTSRVKNVNQSTDKTTTKLLIQLQDGGEIETVIMRYNGKHIQGHGARNTVCVSSQVILHIFVHVQGWMCNGL